MNEDICILHLSDLHIEDQSSDNQNAVSNALKNLIDDISIQAERIKEIILVISGDIAYQGKIEKNKGTIFNFFEKLKDKIGSKVKSIQLVPGNHDIVRGFENKNITEMDSEKSDYDDFELSGYEPYYLMVNKISEVFGIPIKNRTFGVETINCNGYNICFVCIDTAWSSFVHKDQGHLQIGKKQLEILKKHHKNEQIKYNEKRKPIDLTIAVSHYPLGWLTPLDEEEITTNMMDRNFMDVDILLCGHVHNVAVHNFFNHEHSLMTLMTGIGWGNIKPNDAKDQHRYSIYMIDVAKNTCDIMMRKTQNNLQFDFDYSVYTKENEKKFKKYIYPLKMNQPAVFLKMNSSEMLLTKSIHVTDTIMEDIKKASKCIAKFRESSIMVLEKYKNDFLGGLEAQTGNYNEEIFDEICNFLFENEDLSNDTEGIWKKICNEKQYLGNFPAFLKEICMAFIEELKEIFPKNAILRTHFRYHHGKVDGTKITPDNYVILCQDDNGVYLPPAKIVKWEASLIRSSFKTNNSLIYTANKHLNSTKTSWDEFITIIPSFKGSVIEFHVKNGPTKRKRVQRPLLTFGLSVKNCENLNEVTTLVTILDYLDVGDHISDIIDEYVRFFDPDKNNFIKYQIQNMNLTHSE